MSITSTDTPLAEVHLVINHFVPVSVIITITAYGWSSPYIVSVRKLTFIFNKGHRTQWSHKNRRTDKSVGWGEGDGVRSTDAVYDYFSTLFDGMHTHLLALGNCNTPMSILLQNNTYHMCQEAMFSYVNAWSPSWKFFRFGSFGLVWMRSVTAL